VTRPAPRTTISSITPDPVRLPAVAGRFYPSEPAVLSRDLAEYLGSAAGSVEKTEHAIGCIVPHAGYIYSGHVAGSVYRKLPQRSSYIILGPNHFGRGAPLAVTARGTWVTPLGEAQIDASLARELIQNCHLLAEDTQAHAGEHSLEVQVPFLQHLAKKSFSFVPVAIGVSGYAPLEALGRGVAKCVAAASSPVLIIASSDMNHYEPDDVTRLKDRKAIDKILALDAAGLYEVIRREDISMCGYGPAVALLTAAKELGVKKAELMKYATSGDVSGERDFVVGYAGIVLS
jgi:MEMO1 family protein